MIQGPLALARRSRGLGVRIDCAALTAHDPASRSRIHSWISQGIHVDGRPEWVFVKLHTHGAPEAQAESLLGEPGRSLHELLARHYNDGQRYILHYVTAREMFNIALAGMAGHSGDPNAYRDYSLSPHRRLHDRSLRTPVPTPAPSELRHSPTAHASSPEAPRADVMVFARRTSRDTRGRAGQFARSRLAQRAPAIERRSRKPGLGPGDDQLACDLPSSRSSRAPRRRSILRSVNRRPSRRCP